MKTKSKGIPPHVVAKLNLPELPENHYWYLVKSNIIKSPEVRLRRQRRFWFDDKVAWCPVLRPSRALKETVEDCFRYAADQCIADLEMQLNVAKLWEK